MASCNWYFCCREFLEGIQSYKNQCDAVIDEVEQCLEFLTVLKTDYVRVATKTNALHEACENLLEEQVLCLSATLLNHPLRCLLEIVMKIVSYKI